MEAALSERSARFDSRELRQVLGAFVTGVTVVTTVDAHGARHGLTANSFSSVSLDPPLVLWSQSTRAPSHAVFERAPRFAINILAEDQVAMSARFASPGIDRFAGLALDEGSGGVPLLPGCSAWLECRVVARFPGGDHTIHVGEVEAIRRARRRPLVFGGGQYLVADAHDLGAPPPGLGTTLQAQGYAVRLARRAMARLAHEFDVTLALAVWGSHGPTVVAWEASSTPPSRSLPLGLVLPVTTTSSGRALAAHLPLEATGRLVAAELLGAGPQRGDDHHLPLDDAAWQQVLEQVRRDGLARRSPGPFHGADVQVDALAAPVRDASGGAVLAITAIGGTAQFQVDPEWPFARALRAAAADMSQRLGHVADR
jgi:flavin reductase (DIM6/NTAB) family NADH-FMN oxidoreductase RutF